MKLMTKELEKKFARIGNQSESDNPIVVAKFFFPAGAATWWATEYDPETKIFFGYVTGLGFDEWGYFLLEELQNSKIPVPVSIHEGDRVTNGKIPVQIERDLHFESKPIRAALEEYGISYR
jgi:hypothetical protein